MKKLFIVLLLLLSGVSEVKGENEMKALTDAYGFKQYVSIQIVCVDGYKYLITQTRPEFTGSNSGFGVSVVQMMQHGYTTNLKGEYNRQSSQYPPQPVRCR